MDEHQETTARMNVDPASAPSPPLPWHKRTVQMTARRSACILLPLGVLGVWWTWHHVHATAEYYPKIAFISPFIIVLGVFYLMYPLEDPTKFPKPFVLRHWLLFAVGLAAGAANWYAIANGLY